MIEGKTALFVENVPSIRLHEIVLDRYSSFSCIMSIGSIAITVQCVWMIPLARRSSNAYYYYLWILFHRNEAISVLSSHFFSSRTGSLQAQRIRFSSNKIANDTQNLCGTPMRHVIHNTCIMYIGFEIQRERRRKLKKKTKRRKNQIKRDHYTRAYGCLPFDVRI